MRFSGPSRRSGAARRDRKMGKGEAARRVARRFNGARRLDNATAGASRDLLAPRRRARDVLRQRANERRRR